MTAINYRDFGRVIEVSNGWPKYLVTVGECG
jgi:hypothetical protein